MKYGIIAAGEGSRLAEEGIRTPKPLVEIKGEPLVDRLIRIFAQNDAEEIVVICNDHTNLVSEHLDHVKHAGIDGKAVNLSYIVKSTPSSMHSFYELSRFFTSGPFCLTTVDTIFSEDAFARYINYFSQLVCSGDADGLMGVTDFIDDEKPLHVAVTSDMHITGFLDNSTCPHYISAGIYGLTPPALDTLHRCIERGESRMRNFQRALVADGLRLRAFSMGKVMDIDHANDIRKAEDYL